MASVSKESERKNDLTQEEAFRYSRQMILPEIGLEGELELLTWGTRGATRIFLRDEVDQHGIDSC